MSSHVKEIILGSSTIYTAEAAYQYDAGVVLLLKNVPYTSIICYLTTENSSVSIPQKVQMTDGSCEIPIPDALFNKPRDIYCYVSYEEAAVKQTLYKIILPVLERPEVSDVDGTFLKLDSTLTKQGYASDAKTVGDRLSTAEGVIEDLQQKTASYGDNVEQVQQIAQTVLDAEERIKSIVAYRLEIVSTSDVLSSDIQQATLSARVWYGTQNITNSVDASRFQWERVSADSAADALWNAAHAGMKAVIITTKDVLYSATYSCSLKEELQTAILATSSKTIIDLSDGKSLSVYLHSNQPQTQIYNANTAACSPDWTTTSGKLNITPAIYADQIGIPLTDSALSIVWKRKEGNGTETELTTGENVSGNVLTVSANKLTGISSGALTYLVYATYTDPDTELPINAVASITFTLVRTGENAKTVWISGEQAFKYTASGIVSPSQITLSANVQNVTISKWQYKDSGGAWVDYPTTSDNTSITDSLLIVKPTHAVFVDDVATLRVITSDSSISDVIGVYKMFDGSTGESGTDGENASVVFLTNENITFAGNASGLVPATTKTCSVVAYTGTTKATPTIEAITGAPEGMTVSVGAVNANEIPLTIAVAANSDLGDSGPLNGELSVPITSPISTTLKLSWSKVNTGATGTNAVVFSLYAPNGSVFTNGTGMLTIKAQAYNGTTPISSGATYAWAKYTSGSWTTISDQTGSSLSVEGSTVDGLASYRCIMTYGGKTYQDIITLTDKTDNYQAVIESSGGNIFKNTIGTTTLTCRLFQNGEEVDATGATCTYKWYRRDQNGDALDDGAVFYIGKSCVIDGGDVDVKTTFICEIELEHLITTAQYTVADLADPVQQGTAPDNPITDMLWLDTSTSPAMLRRYDGAAWVDVGADAAEVELKLADVYAEISTSDDAIRQEVASTYALSTDLTQTQKQLKTLSEQTDDNFTWSVSQINNVNSSLSSLSEATEEQFKTIQTYMTFAENGLTIGKSGNPFTFRVVNDRLSFYMNESEVAYLSDNKLYVTEAEILTRMQLGLFAFEPQSNGNMSIVYTGGNA